MLQGCFHFLISHYGAGSDVTGVFSYYAAGSDFRKKTSVTFMVVEHNGAEKKNFAYNWTLINSHTVPTRFSQDCRLGNGVGRFENR